jgi:thioredoxin-related protein
MAKFTDIIKKVFSQYKLRVLVIFLLVVFISFAVYSYSTTAIPLAEKKDTIDIANANRRTKYCEIYFFNASWCPHCVKCKNAWSQFVNTYDKSTINGYTINCIGGVDGVDCSTKDDPKVQELLQSMKIDHFPTVKLVKDQITIDFDAKVTEENLTKFVNSVL